MLLGKQQFNLTELSKNIKIKKVKNNKKDRKKLEVIPKSKIAF